MMTSLKLIIFAATCCVCLGAELPSSFNFTPCKRDLPKEEFSACILEQSRKVLSTFVKGVPEFGIESMDPLALDDFTANAGTFTLKETNTQLIGLKKMKITDMRWDLEKNFGSMKIFGNLTLLADYEANGRVLVIPITGNGKMTVKMYNTEIALKFKLKKVIGDDGREHMSTHDLKPTQSYENVKLHLSNILGGSAIGDTINQVLNANWRELFKEVGPPQTKAISYKVHDLINKFYARVPLDELMQ